VAETVRVEDGFTAEARRLEFLRKPGMEEVRLSRFQPICEIRAIRG
jgi:hypothetical protein